MKKGNIALTTVAVAVTLVGSFAFKPHSKSVGSPLFTDQGRVSCNVVACNTTGSLSAGNGCLFSSSIPVYTSQTSCTNNTPWTISRTQDQ